MIVDSGGTSKVIRVAEFKTMFDTLKSKLADVFDGLARRGALSDSDVDAALREVRLALLDADVALPAVKAFTEKSGTGSWRCQHAGGSA